MVDFDINKLKSLFPLPQIEKPIPSQEELLEFLDKEENKNAQPHIPTDSQRITALENAIADLAILLSQNLDNEENV